MERRLFLSLPKACGNSEISGQPGVGTKPKPLERRESSEWERG